MPAVVYISKLEYIVFNIVSTSSRPPLVDLTESGLPPRRNRSRGPGTSGAGQGAPLTHTPNRTWDLSRNVAYLLPVCTPHASIAKAKQNRELALCRATLCCASCKLKMVATLGCTSERKPSKLSRIGLREPQTPRNRCVIVIMMFGI